MSRTRRTAFALLIVTLATTALLLCRWQLHRLWARRASNGAILTARALPPLDYRGGLTQPVPGRRLLARGQFEPGDQMLLRGRVHDQAPGLEVATAFRIAGSETVLWVLRGFVASPDAATIPDVPTPTPGEVTITGLTLAVPTTSDSGQRLVRGSDTTWRRLDQAVIADRTPSALPVYLLLDGGEGGPGRLPAVDPPVLDDGPHLSYALQWFGIALAILAFGIIAWRRADPGSAQPPAAP
ncbi:MAG: SURF1 family protein [Gemmatimonadota bacterium]